MRKILGAACFVGLLACVVLANVVTARYGFVPVGFGLTATAGTFFAGFALALRDGLQDSLGRWVTVLAVVVGAAISYFVSIPALALASGVAFLLGELIDLLVYTPLRSRARFGDWLWAAAVVASGLVGAIVDTVVFLWIAFGFAAVGPALIGQLVGKGWATLAYLVVGKLGQRAVQR